MLFSMLVQSFWSDGTSFECRVRSEVTAVGLVRAWILTARCKRSAGSECSLSLAGSNNEYCFWVFLVLW